MVPPILGNLHVSDSKEADVAGWAAASIAEAARHADMR